MLRIIDMSQATGQEGSFSVWDTVTDRFLRDDDGDQYWYSFEDFEQGGFSDGIVQRVGNLLQYRPKYLRYTDDLMKGPEQKEFENLYLGMPRQLTEKEIALRELAKTYHYRCEKFDRAVCTGPVTVGGVRPRTEAERAAVAIHARAVREELGWDVARLGFSPRDWDMAIQEVGRDYRYPEGDDA